MVARQESACLRRVFAVHCTGPGAVLNNILGERFKISDMSNRLTSARIWSEHSDQLPTGLRFGMETVTPSSRWPPQKGETASMTLERASSKVRDYDLHTRC
jgi:hypothetical protein